MRLATGQDTGQRYGWLWRLTICGQPPWGSRQRRPRRGFNIWWRPHVAMAHRTADWASNL